MKAARIESMLEELKQERAALDVIIEALERAREVAPSSEMGSARTPSGSDSLPKGVTTSEIPRNAFYGLKIPDAILHYLSVSHRKQTAQDIADALKTGGVSSKSKNFYSTVYTALVRLEESGQVGKFGREWGLSEWFPGAARKRPKASGDNGGDESDG